MSKKNLVFKKKLVAHALTMAFGVGVFTVGVSPTVMAQSNASGTVFGKVAPGSATSVALKNTDTNLSRTVTIDATGKFQATALPPGRYTAILMKDATVLANSEFDVLAGQGVEPNFGIASGVGVQSVEVSARRNRIDVSSATNGATFTAKELDKLPMTRNVDAIIQLAPNTTRADPRYAGGASLGGGGASENAYYINGFPVTNPLTQLGASELPFGGISQAQVLTGGFGAEFGRSVGGIINITTKSGTNNWEVGGTVSFAPKSLRSDVIDIYFPVIPGTSSATVNNGKLFRARKDDTLENWTYGGYVGGPIIKDKVFMFLAAEAQKTNTSGTNPGNNATSLNNATAGWREQEAKLQRYLGKFDWNITDDHRLELTLMGDSPKRDNSFSGYTYAKTSTNDARTRLPTGVTSTQHFENVGENGGETQILKYTGNLTNDLTLTALYGQSKAKHVNSFGGSDQNQFFIVADTGNQAPGITYNNPQPVSGNVLSDGSQDQIKSFRLDLEYKIGQHTVRAGLDNNKLSSINAGDRSSGGGTWTYLKNPSPGSTLKPGGADANGNTVVLPAMATGYGPLAAQGYYVDKTLFTDVTNAYSNTSAQYIEDRYQITKDVLITAGVRRESFDNANGDQQKYIEQKNQIAPRLSAVWDVNGDSSTKVFGSLGRYHLQIPTHLAVRGASRSTFTDTYYAYTGVAADGTPTGLTQLGGPASGNNEFGQQKDYQSVSATNLKPTYQDEITLGFEKAFSPALNFGAKLTYRTLKSTIDDWCDDRPIRAWAARNNVNVDNWGGFNCSNINPGEDVDLKLDFTGQGKQQYSNVHLTAAETGLPKVERKYVAVDLFAEHPYRNGWYGKLNYTWSRSKGNTEGQTLSDVAQTDVAATQTWDYAELMKNANGLLPNDRTHQIKAYGFYDLNSQWTVGGNLLLAAGRPRSCLGTDPNPGDSPNYNSASHNCGGLTAATNTPSPRGSIGNLEWDRRLDLNVVYKPEQIKGFSFKLDVFNVFNAQTVQAVEERSNNRNALRNIYQVWLSTTPPRSAKLTAEYNYKF